MGMPVCVKYYKIAMHHATHNDDDDDRSYFSIPLLFIVHFVQNIILYVPKLIYFYFVQVLLYT